MWKIGKCLFSFLILFLSAIPGFAQSPQPATPRLHAGLSALPVFDPLKFFPANRIRGAAVMANFGCFIRPRLSFGINPYYGNVVNEYPTAFLTPYGERQDLTVAGLNVSFRGYVLAKPRFSAFIMVAGGFGVMNERFVDLAVPGGNPYMNVNSAVSAFVAGPGFSWNLSSNLAIEANVDFVSLYNFSGTANESYFTAVLPTAGVQYFWQKQ